MVSFIGQDKNFQSLEILVNLLRMIKTKKKCKPIGKI